MVVQHHSLHSKLQKIPLHIVLLDWLTKLKVQYCLILHKAIKPVNQLRMIEDALVIYRISRAPERRIFYIDVGNLPKLKRTISKRCDESLSKQVGV